MVLVLITSHIFWKSDPGNNYLIEAIEQLAVFRVIYTVHSFYKICIDEQCNSLV